MESLKRDNPGRGPAEGGYVDASRTECGLSNEHHDGAWGAFLAPEWAF